MTLLPHNRENKWLQKKRIKEVKNNDTFCFKLSLLVMSCQKTKNHLPSFATAAPFLIGTKHGVY
jgi:hypothetical protein